MKLDMKTYFSITSAYVLSFILLFVLITPYALGSGRLIESIDPTSAAVGSTVKITGTNLSNSIFIIDPKTGGNTQNTTGTVNADLTQTTFSVPGNLRRASHIVKSGPSLTDISNGISLLITSAGAPVIEAIHPLRTVPGDPVTVYGFNLTNDARLKSEDGLEYSVSGTVSRSAKELRFEIPSDIPTGLYSVVVISPDGTTESSQKININNGGEPFNRIIRPNLPTEGLPGLGQLVAIIFTWSINLLGIVVFVMIFYAGFKWATAAGNTARVNEARGQISNAILGAIILLSAWIILNTINPDLVGGTLTLPGIEARIGE